MELQEIQGEPLIKVGIMTEQEIRFKLNGEYLLKERNERLTGEHVVRTGEPLLLDGTPLPSASLSPTDASCHFDLEQVTIGVNFHWERKENQRFNGELHIIPTPQGITAINLIPAEDYLLSVISSEMSATSSLELLKAHAVISRSWLIAQLKGTIQPQSKDNQDDTDWIETPERLIKWYDHDDHEWFDVCADDHCQRYQGITKVSTESVRKAIEATRGKILVHNGKLCDARFSKSCGGMTETFESCWEGRPLPYLVRLRDLAHNGTTIDLTEESAAEKWIRESPDAFCRTNDKQILSQVLNDYDQETNDFYRWKEEFSQDELAELIRKKTGIDFGLIKDLKPLKRGVSGRIIELEIVGTKRRRVIGKELEIRKTLSESHLYSSAFTVEKHDFIGEIPQRFTLHGAGWGHGVGLCQIGAAVMAAQGYTYDEILTHYYPGAEIVRGY